MKNKVLYTLISLFALGNVSAAEIGSATRQEIGRTLSRIVSREVTSGYQKPEPITVRVQAVKASRSRVRIYATAALANYPFREENLRAMRDSVRALLPHEFRKAAVELYTDGREASELIPLACRNATQLRKAVDKKKIVLFTNRSGRPLVTRLSAPDGDFRDAISPCGRATDAISTRRRTAGNGSVRRSGRPARTSIRKAMSCRTWFRCSKTPGHACCCRANATCRNTKCWPTFPSGANMRFM